MTNDRVTLRLLEELEQADRVEAEESTTVLPSMILRALVANDFDLSAAVLDVARDA